MTSENTSHITLENIAEFHAPQLDDWDCGVKIIDVVAKLKNLPVSESEVVISELQASPEIGTDHRQIEAYYAKRDIPHQVYYDGSVKMIEDGLNKHSVFIVGYQSVETGDEVIEKGKITTWRKEMVEAPNREYPQWGHYSVIMGQSDGEFYLLDPGLEKEESVNGLPPGVRVIPKDVFEERWFDMEIDGTKFNKWCIEFPKV